MPAFSPADLRAGSLHFLLDLEWGGRTYLFAEQRLTPTLDGVTLEYAPAMAFAGSWQDQLDLFAITPTARTASMTLDFHGIADVPARVSEGFPLAAAVGTLRMWLSGTTTAETVLVGDVRRAQYGAEDGLVRLSLEEMPLRAPGLIPGHAQRIGGPSEHDDGLFLNLALSGNFWPIIIGWPGGAGGYGSPALVYNVSNPSSMVIAAHECVPGTVELVEADSESTETITVETNHDAFSGALRTKVDTTLTGLTPFTPAKQPFYVRWTQGNAGGIPSRTDPTVPMRGAGDVLTWLMEQSGARIDYGRQEASAQALNAYKVDAAIVAPKGERTNPLEWAQAHLLPILPVSARMSSRGLYYMHTRIDATANDAVASLSADQHQMARVGAVEYTDSDETRQGVRFEYAMNRAGDNHTSSLYYTGRREDLVNDTTAVLSRDLERSFSIYARGDALRMRTFETSSDVIQEDATAHLICQHLARRFALQARIVRYEADPEFAWLEPGDVVLLTDEDLSFTSEVALVEGVIWTDRAHVGLTLRVLN